MMFLLTHHAGGEDTTIPCATLDEVFADIAEEHDIDDDPQSAAYREEMDARTSFSVLPTLEALLEGTRIPLDIHAALDSLATHHSRLRFSKAIEERFARLRG